MGIYIDDDEEKADLDDQEQEDVYDDREFDDNNIEGDEEEVKDSESHDNR